jgi:hypothetical protein
LRFLSPCLATFYLDSKQQQIIALFCCCLRETHDDILLTFSRSDIDQSGLYGGAGVGRVVVIAGGAIGLSFAFV